MFEWFFFHKKQYVRGGISLQEERLFGHSYGLLLTITGDLRLADCDDRNKAAHFMYETVE